MIRALPENPVELLNGRHEADRISANLNTAFWMHGRDDDTARFLLYEAHKEFAALAEALGYAITPIDAPSTSEVAA
jgi:hypothetical protein